MHYTTNTLIVVAMLAWALQILLGWWQVTRFNKAFSLLCKKGNVGVGRSSGRFMPKVVIAVALDQERRVVDSLLMKGFSVFSRPQSISALQGLSYTQIDPKVIFPHSKACQKALEVAICLR